MKKNKYTISFYLFSLLLTSNALSSCARTADLLAVSQEQVSNDLLYLFDKKEREEIKERGRAVLCALLASNSICPTQLPMDKFMELANAMLAPEREESPAEPLDARALLTQLIQEEVDRFGETLSTPRSPLHLFNKKEREKINKKERAVLYPLLLASLRHMPELPMDKFMELANVILAPERGDVLAGPLDARALLMHLIQKKVERFQKKSNTSYARSFFKFLTFG